MLQQANHFFALLLLAMMGAAVTTLMPLLVGAYTDSGHFSATQVGWLTSADVFGILLTSASAFFWSRRVNWRLVSLLATSLFIVCNYLSAQLTDFYSLMVLRLFAGIGCGAAYAISLAALGDYSKSDKAFSALVTIQVIFGTVGFWLLPNIIGQQGIAGIFEFFNLCLLPALILIAIGFPTNQKPQHNTSLRIDGNVNIALMIFLSVVLYYFAQGTVWAYLERIGAAAAISGGDIGDILAIGFAISAIGSLLSGNYVEKWGRRSGLYLTAILQLPCLVALYWMTPEYAFWIYAFTTVLYQLMWSFIVPILMAIFNDTDKSGKLIVLCVAAFKVGLVIGPPVAGLVVSTFAVKEVLWLGAISILLSVIVADKANQQLSSKA